MKKKPTKKPTKEPKLTYDAKYRGDNPLLTSHVPKPVYEEVKRLAAEDRRSMSQWLALFLEKTLLKASPNA